MSEDLNKAVGRRIADEVARWSTAAAALLAAALLSFVLFFYGSLPKDIQHLREAVSVISVELRVIKEEQRNLLEQNRVAQNWRERLVSVEKEVDKNSAQLLEHEKRITKVEEPFSVFGGKGKKK